MQCLDKLKTAGHRPRKRLVESRRVSFDQRSVLGEKRYALGQSLGQRTAGIVLEMPRYRNDVRDYSIEFGGVVDQLGEEMPKVPLEEDRADIEHDSGNRGTIDIVPGSHFALRRISPGAP
jgi:hypothetical protein